MGRIPSKAFLLLLSWSIVVVVDRSAATASADLTTELPDSGSSSNNRTNNETGEEQERRIESLIEEAARQLEQARFQGDPVLSQTIDRLNQKTYYKQKNPGDGWDTILERESIDQGLPVIVIPVNGDSSTKHGSKRTYTVLKQTEEQKKLYYVFYAYARKFLGNDDPTTMIQVDGENLRIEWDVWTQPGTSKEKHARAFGWTTCADSIFVACKSEGKQNDSKKDPFEYSDEFSQEAGVHFKDGGGGVEQTIVTSPSWGLNQAAKSDLEASFVGTVFGKASWNAADESLGDEMVDGGTGEESDDTLDFFGDLDDDVADARVISIGSRFEMSEADFFSKIGWQTQDIPEYKLTKTGGSLFEDQPFVGYGTCPFKKNEASDLDAIEEPYMAVEFYLIALRTQCSKNQMRKILRLFNRGLLTINGDVTFSIPSTNLLVTTPKLTLLETQQFSRAFEISMFTQVYEQELRTPSLNFTDPDGARISRSVFTVISMALHSLTQARENIPTHYILLIRNLLKTLKSTNVKAVQDYDRLHSCKDCPLEEKERAEKNVFSLQAIQQFLINALPVVEKGLDPYTAYEHFFQKFHGLIDKKTKLFL